jgi:hypothetical protein
VPSEVIEEKPGSLGLPGFDELEDIRDGADIGGPWIVVLYNCECHSFDDVIGILQKAIGCSVEKGFALALEVHTKGRAIVFSGEREECEKVANIIASIRLQVETDHA